MCIEITRCTAKLRCIFTSFQCIQLLRKTVNKHHYLFTQTCRRGWLSMCFSQHRHRFPFFGILFQLINELFHLRNIHLLQCFFQWKRHTGVINILRSQSKMNEFFVCIQATNFVKLLFYEIFYSLNIVVSGLFYLLNSCSRRFIKVAIDVPQAFKQRMIKAFQLWQRQLTKRDKVFNLNTNSVSYQRIFREIIGKRFCFCPITTINWRDGGQCIKFHNDTIQWL